MTLVTVAHCISHLRLPDSSESALLTIYRAEALARIIAYIGRPIEATTRTFRDPAATHVAYGVVARLSLPEWPVDPESVTVTDQDGAAVPADEYTVQGDEGFIEAVSGGSFSNGPYSVEADVGLATSSRYAAEFEPIVNGAILDLVADKYHRRNPGASSENAAGGLSRSYFADEIPPAIRARLDALRLVRG